LGLAERIGGGRDCFLILPIFARPIARSTVWSITKDELAGEAVKRAIESLDLSIRDKIGDAIEDGNAAQHVGGLPVNGDLLEDLEEDPDFEQDNEAEKMPALEQYTREMFDAYLLEATKVDISNNRMPTRQSYR
jgi:hypothetical protein